jgi:hypothetical protein
MQTDTQVTAPQTQGHRNNGDTQSENSFCAMMPSPHLDNWKTSMELRELSKIYQYQGLVQVPEPLQSKLLALVLNKVH